MAASKTCLFMDIGYMPAHVRSVLTTSELTVPIMDGQLALGTWQGIFLYEHRLRAFQRQVVVSLLG